MKKSVFLVVLGSAFLAGCPKHEIIPAPTPEVELQSHLMGTINGTNVEFTQNVNGYGLDATKTKIILSSPQPSSAVYYSDMKSTESLVSVRIGLGSIQWDAAVSSDPTVGQFNSFFTNAANAQPPYSTNAATGFEVVYRDGSGNIWTSDQSDTGNTCVFSNIVQESDGSGDYSKFKCTFSCTVHRLQINPSPAPPTPLSLQLSNMVFEGWFKR